MSRFKYLYGSSTNPDAIVGSGNSNAANTDALGSANITVVSSDLTPNLLTFTAVAATDIITLGAAPTNAVAPSPVNGYPLGLTVQVSNSGGGLPGGLSASTNYYWIPITITTGYLATSYANAVAGSHINLTTDGTGTQTMTPSALAGGNAILQSAQSNQGAVVAATWANVPNTTTDISTPGVFNFPILNTDFPFYRIAFSGNTAGILGVTATFSGK